MANCLPFSKNQNMTCEDGTVTWTNELVNENQLEFSNTEVSLNETYATTRDDDETQYLSVLHSTDDTLEDINNLTLDNEKLIVNHDVASNIENDNLDSAETEQVVIFNVGESQEVYGIQISHDEEGNTHRYQFQFRKTENGQLEAMPETIQLLANEEDTTHEFTEDQVSGDTFEHPVLLQEAFEQTNEDSHHQLIMSEETNDILENQDSVDGNIYNDEEGDIPTTDNSIIYIKNENMCDEMSYEDDEELNEDYESNSNEEIIDIKPGVEIVKHEVLHKQNEVFVSENQETQSENSEELIVKEDYASEADSYSTVGTENQGEETIISYQHVEPNVEEYYEDSTEAHLEHHAATHFLVEENNLDQFNYNIELHQEEKEENNKNSANVLIVEKSPGTNDSENEDFEFEGLPVTAEGEISEDTSSSIYQETEVLYSEPEISLRTLSPKVKSPSNILKQPTNINKVANSSKKTILYYMLPSTDQKENLNSITLKATNPRSVLKNNIDLHKINNERIKTMQREKLMEKRYARSKEVIQAKMFNNFINKTTIPHAPVRQGRLPRKQEIKPVDTRTNEEIIVQEVMVSSKGFVENLTDRLKNLDKLEVTSIVELSDSDEEYDPKNSMKKKKKHKKIILTNAGSSDSDTSVIEIHSDGETTVKEKSQTPNQGRSKKDSESSEGSLKRSRGKTSKSGSSNEDSPQKKSRTEESSEVESDIDKREINCPHCSKTFPNQNSLSTHIQHHNLENSLRNSKKIPAFEYKHKCEDCKQTFKNSILLKRHICNSSNKSRPTYKCTTCPKTFRDIAIFNIHKKSHIKENLIKSTSNVTISPKKFTSVPSTATYKCKECSKVCSSQNILTVHEKSHKKFNCIRCNTSFPSKLLLDLHVRIKCVKTSSPKDRRLSFKIKRSFVNSPCRTVTRGRSINPVKPLISGTLNKKSSIPTTSCRKTINVIQKNVEPSSNISKDAGSSKNFNTVTKKNINLKPNNTLNLSKNINFDQRKSSKTLSRTRTEKMKSSSLLLETSNVETKFNPGLDNSSMMRRLDVEAQCDSCSLMFNSLTALFKHKVKVHGLSTPDKRVLETKKKLLHKPLHLHGGIPPNQTLKKAFQEIRKKLISANVDFSDNMDNSNKPQLSTEVEKDELPKIIISESTSTDQ
ncbi:uncharacterized protein LOC130440788 [Diorhabda sublineata]|uniref:uncharacterized protein LOC130440788 n=1 Tax=Diorhabda sublineata TaxID=1163346 RepID=UPI0024E0EC9F|nr:uncharacterized protein LOC130440788 [Diorhabda sublineata]